MILYAYGAYGREVRQNDWHSGLDFSIGGTMGPYFSIRDMVALREAGYTEIQFLCRKGWVMFAVKV